MVRMRSIMETILLDIMFDLPGLEGVEKVVISRQVVEGISPPLYIYADVPLRVGDADAVRESGPERQTAGLVRTWR
jgi:ATP-dependent Clp protease ATP-binding subunit ClpX